MFTGTPVVKQVADDCVRITGVSLVDGASGTIGLFESTEDPPVGIRLPDGFKARGYSRPGSESVGLADCVQVSVVYAGEDLPDNTELSQVVVNKFGTTPQDFKIVIDSLDTSGEGEGDTGLLEIYIRFF